MIVYLDYDYREWQQEPSLECRNSRHEQDARRTMAILAMPEHGQSLP